MIPLDRIVDLWATEVTELSKKYQWVQVFENKDSIMDCAPTLVHMGQICACDFLPIEVLKQHQTQL